MAHVQLFDGYDADSYRPADLVGSTVAHLSSGNETFSWSDGRYFMSLSGAGLTYGGANGVLLTGGVVTGFSLAATYGRIIITEAHADAAVLGLAYTVGDNTLGASTLLAGDDTVEEVVGAPQTSTPNADEVYLARAWGGNDLMLGGGTRSSFFGGDGNDTLDARAGDGNYLRGEAGDDSVRGAAGFDDINGNMGADTARGGAGDDWVVGGKDNDLLYGDAGADLVYGNMGADTVSGGDGADVVRGGQDDDVIAGGAGDDYVSGDRGDDTVSGGAGADIFHGFQDAGIDRVLDFRVSEGDRVVLDAGTIFQLSQAGADTVIDMGGLNRMILVGVSLGALPAGWITVG
jgi:Ca2+-binding RTX toxin-like protein